MQDDIFEMARAMFSQRSTGWAPLDDDDNLGSALQNENTSHICYGLCGKSGTGTSISLTFCFSFTFHFLFYMLLFKILIFGFVSIILKQFRIIVILCLPIQFLKLHQAFLKTSDSFVFSTVQRKFTGAQDRIYRITHACFFCHS